MVEAAPPLKKQNVMAPKRRMSNKYCHARKVLADLMTTHVPEELEYLLTASTNFPTWGCTN